MTGWPSLWPQVLVQRSGADLSVALMLARGTVARQLRSPVMKTALVIVTLLTLLGVTVAWAIWGWEQTASTDMGFHGWLAMILGIVVTSLVGFGLMGLMFYSSRHGYDERARSKRDRH